jgi:hypothetical protein
LRVFVSYRRDDSISTAGRIRDRLASQLGADNVYFDIDSIPLGVDFRQHIDRMVADCDVVLVVIGRRWVDAVDEQGHRRLEQTGDFVRLEVEAALRREIPVVPVLVDGATIPQPAQLPKSLTDLAYRNGTQVRHDPDFHPDIDRLLRRLLPAQSAPASPHTPEPPTLPVEQPVPPDSVVDSGAVASSGNVNITGTYVAGRDLVIDTPAPEGEVD